MAIDLKSLFYKIIAASGWPLLAINALVGLAAMIVGGYGLSQSRLAELPTDLFAGVLVAGLFLVLASGVAMAGYVNLGVPWPFFVALGASVLCAFGLMIAGAVGGGSQYVASALFEENWQVSPSSMHTAVERSFGCCGFSTQADFYGPGWNQPCLSSETTKRTCCAKMRLGVGMNLTQLTGSCQPTELRYECCSSALKWPCYRLSPCFEVVMQWWRVTTDHTSTFGLVASAIALVCTALLFVTVVLMRNRHTALIRMGEDPDEAGL